MNNEELLELRRILLDANENNDWSTVEEAIDFINEFVDIEDDPDEI
jgi:hemerythrin-like domain-containing protein